jgi:hypothetical protein
MSTERLILIIAGSFILISLLLAHIYNGASLTDGPTWLWFTAFVGANLLQSAFTGFCPLAKILKALGARPSSETFKY